MEIRIGGVRLTSGENTTVVRTQGKMPSFSGPENPTRTKPCLSFGEFTGAENQQGTAPRKRLLAIFWPYKCRPSRGISPSPGPALHSRPASLSAMAFIRAESGAASHRLLSFSQNIIWLEKAWAIFR